VHGVRGPTGAEAPICVRFGVPILSHASHVNLRTGHRLAVRITNYASYVYDSVTSHKNQREGYQDRLQCASAPSLCIPWSVSVLFETL
jgi:hypothetical protein